MGSTQRLTVLVRRGAAVLAAVSLAVVALEGVATATTQDRVNPAGLASPVAGLDPIDESWFVDPLTPRQRAREIAVPAHPTRFNGRPLRWTEARLRTADGSLAVPARMAVGHTLVAGQALTLSDAGLFTFHRVRLTAHARRLLARLAPSLELATSVRCEGYSDFGSNRMRSSTSLSLARARALCRAVRAVAPGVTATPVSVGNRRPVVVGRHAPARRDNRRVVLVVTASGPSVTAPSAPVLTAADPGNGRIYVEFTPPLDNGGSPVTAYQASFDEGAWADLELLTVVENTGVVVGLTNGQTYSVRIRAVNAAGAGAASNSMWVTPSVCAGVPGLTALAC